MSLVRVHNFSVSFDGFGAGAVKSRLSRSGYCWPDGSGIVVRTRRFFT